MRLTIKNLTAKKVVLSAGITLAPKATRTLDLTIQQLEAFRPKLLRLNLAGSISFYGEKKSTSSTEDILEGAIATSNGGGSSPVFQFSQPSPALVWVINHNFGYFPRIDSLTTGGVLMETEVIRINVNQAQVIFKTPTAGTAHVS